MAQQDKLKFLSNVEFAGTIEANDIIVDNKNIVNVINEASYLATEANEIAEDAVQNANDAIRMANDAVDIAISSTDRRAFKTKDQMDAWIASKKLTAEEMTIPNGTFVNAVDRICVSMDLELVTVTIDGVEQQVIANHPTGTPTLYDISGAPVEVTWTNFYVENSRYVIPSDPISSEFEVANIDISGVGFAFNGDGSTDGKNIRVAVYNGDSLTDFSYDHIKTHHIAIGTQFYVEEPTTTRYWWNGIEAVLDESNGGSNAPEVSIVQTTGNSETAVMSQKAVTEIFDSFLEKEETGGYEEIEVASLSISDFSQRGETARGETALIEVTPDTQYILRFDRCPYSGEGYGAASLYLSQYNDSGEIVGSENKIPFERIGTGMGTGEMLYTNMFPNGGFYILVINEGIKYIRLMFDAYLGAPERLPEGLTFSYRSFTTEYVKIKAEMIPEKTIGIESLEGARVISNNLFNKKTATTAETVYLGKSNAGVPLYGWFCGAATDSISTSVSSSGFDSTSTAIEIEGGASYHVSHSCVKSFFDENDCWISYSPYPLSRGSFVAPNDAKYMRLSFVSTEKNQLHLVKGDTPLPYDDWKLGVEDLATDKSAEVEELLSRHALHNKDTQKYMREIAEEAHKYTAPDRHTFIFVSDTHANTASNRVMSMVASMTKYVPCSYVAHGGDIINGVSEKKNELMLLTTLVRNGNDANCPVYYVKGNHDWNLLYVRDKSASPDEYILNSELARRTNCFNKKNIHGNIDDMYFYVDDDTTKIRTIFLSCCNKDESGDRSALNNNTQVFGAEQLSWLINDALNFTNVEDKADWGVIVIHHQSSGSGLWKIFNGFKNGASGTTTGAEGDNLSVAFDFTAQGAMNLIANFVGDIHHDNVSKAGTTPIIFILNASTSNDKPNGSSSSPSALASPPREFGTETETAFDIVTIDKVNHKIYMTRYGARSYAYNDETGVFDKIAARTRIVDYSTGECIVRTE